MYRALSIAFLALFLSAGSWLFVKSAAAPDPNRSISFPGGNPTTGDEWVTVTTDFDSSGVCDYTADECTFYVRAKASSWGSIDWYSVFGATDGGWGRGVALSKRSTSLRFFAGGWNVNFVEVSLPSADTWFNAVGRLDKDGSGVQLCVNGTDGTGDTMTVDISDSFTFPLRIGTTQASGFGANFEGVIDEFAAWPDYMDDTSKGTLCASSYKGNPADVFASPSVQYRIDSSDTIATDGIADTGSLNLDGDADDELSISTDVAP